MNLSKPLTPDDETVVELRRAIETPENVVLTYRLAGPALRFWAYLIDLGIRFCVLALAGIVVALTEVIVVEGIPTGMFLVLWFFLEWGYFAAMEGFFRGKTIGKQAINLRVIQEAGYPISLWSALLRNFLRAADMIPLYGIGFISMFVSGNFLRLGDLAAGTVVIEERRVRLPREPIILDKIQPLSRSVIGTYVPPHRTLALTEEFLQRRFVLSHERGHELATRLANVLAKKLNFSGESSYVEEYPMAFLARVYVTFHRTMNDEDDGPPPRSDSQEAEPALSASQV